MQEQNPIRTISAVSLLSALEFLMAWNELCLLYVILLVAIMISHTYWPKASSFAEVLLAVAALSSSKSMYSFSDEPDRYLPQCTLILMHHPFPLVLLKEGPATNSYPMVVLIASLAFKTLVAQDIGALTTGVLLLCTYFIAQRSSPLPLPSPSPSPLPLPGVLLETAQVKRDVSPPSPPDIRELFEVLPVGVAVKSKKTGLWEYCNPALCQLLAAPEKSACFAKMAAIEDQANQSLANSNRVESHSSPKKHEGGASVQLLVPCPSGGRAGGASEKEPGSRDRPRSSPRPEPDSKVVELSRRGIAWAGQSEELYVCYDLTEAKRSEHRRTTNIIQAKMLRTLSHELRTPINCILNSLEYCKQAMGVDVSGVEENLNIAMANCNMLFSKYSDILVSEKPLLTKIGLPSGVAEPTASHHDDLQHPEPSERHRQHHQLSGQAEGPTLQQRCRRLGPHGDLLRRQPHPPSDPHAPRKRHQVQQPRRVNLALRHQSPNSPPQLPSHRCGRRGQRNPEGQAELAVRPRRRD
jgi:hypothetical protein